MYIGSNSNMLEKSLPELMIIIVHIRTSTHYVYCHYNFIEGVVKTKKTIFDNQTDGNLYYPYHLTYIIMITQ